MRTFTLLWLGQMASSVGSSMTYFALTLWVWQQTQSATAIALILVFYQFPQLFTTLICGILVDRIPHKLLLIFSDTGAASCTITVGILSALNLLQLWHIYLIAIIIGCFGNLQTLTYTTLVPLLVPQKHHTRASSMGAMVGYGSDIISPAFAGLLYPTVGLLGITSIDLGTFAIALLTLLFVCIPSSTTHPSQCSPTKVPHQFSSPETHPPQSPLIKGGGSGPPLRPTDTLCENQEGVRGGSSTAAQLSKEDAEFPSEPSFWRTVTFGFRYIASHRRLLVMVVMLSTFSFLNQMNHTLYQPLVLLRTGDDTRLLGLVVAASGLGGVVVAIAISI